MITTQSTLPEKTKLIITTSSAFFLAECAACFHTNPQATNSDKTTCFKREETDAGEGERLAVCVTFDTKFLFRERRKRAENCVRITKQREQCRQSPADDMADEIHTHRALPEAQLGAMTRSTHSDKRQDWRKAEGRRPFWPSSFEFRSKRELKREASTWYTARLIQRALFFTHLIGPVN